MKKQWQRAFLILAMGMTSSCVTNGERFSSNVEWIQENVTDKARVRQALGEPYSVGNSGGRETWTYGFYRYRLIGKSYQKELRLYWNADGTVNTFSFNSSFPDDTETVAPK